MFVVVGADGHLGIGGYLPGHGLDMAGLDVQFSVDDFGSPERTDLGLVAVHGGEEVVIGLLEEISYGFQSFSIHGRVLIYCEFG